MGKENGSPYDGAQGQDHIELLSGCGIDDGVAGGSAKAQSRPAGVDEKSEGGSGQVGVKGPGTCSLAVKEPPDAGDD